MRSRWFLRLRWSPCWRLSLMLCFLLAKVIMWFLFKETYLRRSSRILHGLRDCLRVWLRRHRIWWGDRVIVRLHYIWDKSVSKVHQFSLISCWTLRLNGQLLLLQRQYFKLFLLKFTTWLCFKFRKSFIFRPKIVRKPFILKFQQSFLFLESLYLLVFLQYFHFKLFHFHMKSLRPTSF